MRVLNGDGVPGLYAAGELAGGNTWSGDICPGAGVGIGRATYTGPCAVRCIVEDIR